MSLHSDTLFGFRANQSLLFLLNAACLAEKQQILGTPVSSTNQTDRHDITEIFLKVALNTINQTKPPINSYVLV